jgi:hypothetical protein
MICVRLCTLGPCHELFNVITIEPFSSKQGQDDGSVQKRTKVIPLGPFLRRHVGMRVLRWTAGDSSRSSRTFRWARSPFWDRRAKRTDRQALTGIADMAAPLPCPRRYAHVDRIPCMRSGAHRCAHSRICAVDEPRPLVSSRPTTAHVNYEARRDPTLAATSIKVFHLTNLPRRDCVIIGGGPAGLTAAIYLARFHLSVSVFDDGTSRAASIPVSHNPPAFPAGSMDATCLIGCDGRPSNMELIFEALA